MAHAKKNKKASSAIIRIVSDEDHPGGPRGKALDRLKRTVERRLSESSNADRPTPKHHATPKPIASKSEGSKRKSKKVPPDGATEQSMFPAEKEDCNPPGELFGTLPECQSVLDVRSWLQNTYDVFLAKALKGIEGRKEAASRRSDVARLLGTHGATSVFAMIDCKLVLEAFDRLFRALFDNANSNTSNKVYFVTIIDGGGGTSLDQPVIDLAGSQAKAKRTARAIGPNYLGVTELAFFNSLTHSKGGRHLQRHEHILVWGTGMTLYKAKQTANKLCKGYEVNVTDAPRIDVRDLSDYSELNLARMAAYLLKAPHKAMTWCPPRGDKPGHMNHSDANDKFLNYSRLSVIRSMLTFDDVLFAGGDGKGIRSELVTLTRQMAKIEAIKPLPVHPDAIATFWVDAARELPIKNWSLPVIIRRK